MNRYVYVCYVNKWKKNIRRKKRKEMRISWIDCLCFEDKASRTHYALNWSRGSGDVLVMFWWWQDDGLMAVVHNLHMQVPILIAHIRSSLLNDTIDNIQFGSRSFRLLHMRPTGHKQLCSLQQFHFLFWFVLFFIEIFKSKSIGLRLRSCSKIYEFK